MDSSKEEGSQIKALETALYYLAYYDVATGLANRSKFEYEVNKKIQEFEGGSNEFAIVIDKFSNRDEIMSEFQGFLQVFQKPWTFEKRNIFITFSAGVVIYPKRGSDLSLLVANVDTAMWHVKNHGKDGCSFYTTDMQTQRISYIETAH